MAHRIDTTTIVEGPRHIIIHAALVCDGVSGELNETLLDPQNLQPPLELKPGLAIERIWHELSGFSARLEFEYLTQNRIVWVLSEGKGNEMDFCDVGGVKDLSGIDGTGKLMLTTNGFSSVGDAGSIILRVRKRT